MSKAAKKNLRRKEKKRADNAKGTSSGGGVKGDSTTRTSASAGSFSYEAAMSKATQSIKTKSSAAAGEQGLAGADEKRVKALRKKLRQIEKLRQEIDDGILAKPDPDQVAKVNSCDKVEHELQELLEKLEVRWSIARDVL